MQVETSPFGKPSPPPGKQYRGGNKGLKKTTTSKRTGITTGITSTRKTTICSQTGKKIFLLGQLPNVQIAGRLKHYLTKDQGILEILKGYQSPFLFQHLQQELSREIHLSLKEKSVVVEEIGNLLEKVIIEKNHMKKVFRKKSVCE